MAAERAEERRVYIVDGDVPFCRAAERMLQSAGLTAESFASGSAFLEAAPELAGGCALIDLRTPGMGGLELQQKLRATGFTLPVIVMTLKADMQTAVRAMKGGAVDFIEKPFTDDLLLAAIDEALALAVPQALLPDVARESADAALRVAKLSPRERQMLDAIVAGSASKQIAFDLGISIRTVEVHRARMFTRLGTHAVGQAVRLAVMATLAAPPLAARAHHHQPARSGPSRGLPE